VYDEIRWTVDARRRRRNPFEGDARISLSADFGQREKLTSARTGARLYGEIPAGVTPRRLDKFSVPKRRDYESALRRPIHS
jgi:hypothetical protein